MPLRIKPFMTALGFAFAATIALPTAALSETVTLKVSNFGPAKDFMNTGVIAAFLDKVVADSEGTLDYKIFAGGTLGRSPAQQLKLVTDGVADMAFVAPAYTPGPFYDWGVVEIPGLVTSPSEAAVALQRAHEQGLLEAPDGVELMAIFSTEMNFLHGPAELKSLDDLEGMRVRAVGIGQIKALENLGATPVSNLRAPEVAEAMSRGTIEAAVLGSAATRAFRVDAVAKSHIQVPMGMLTLMLPMNAKTWENLPEPAKAAFKKHGYKAFSEFAGKAIEGNQETIVDYLKSREGVTFVDETADSVSEFNARIGNVHESWIDGDPARQEFYDAFSKLLEDIRNEN